MRNENSRKKATHTALHSHGGAQNTKKKNRNSNTNDHHLILNEIQWKFIHRRGLNYSKESDMLR